MVGGVSPKKAGQTHLGSAGIRICQGGMDVPPSPFQSPQIHMVIYLRFFFSFSFMSGCSRDSAGRVGGVRAAAERC